MTNPTELTELELDQIIDIANAIEPILRLNLASTIPALALLNDDALESLAMHLAETCIDQIR